MTKQSTIERAVMSLDDLTNDGGLILPEQTNRFIRKVLDQPTMLNAVRAVRMPSTEYKLNKIGFGSRITYAARQDDSGAGRAPTAAERSKPTTSQVTLTTDEVIAEVNLPYEVLEDNIEGQQLEDTILDLIAQRSALDFEEALLLGDTTNTGDPFLALRDGILKKGDANVVDATDMGDISARHFSEIQKALPTAYRRNRAAMNYFTSFDIEQDYRLALSNRGTALGDDLLTGRTAVPAMGINMRTAALMPNDKMILTNPQNIMWGIWRDIKIEFDKDIRRREIIIVLTARVGWEIEEKEAMSTLINLGASTT